MASSESRRRKQLEKKKKKRVDKKHQITVRRNAGLADQLSMRSKAPVFQCLVAAGMDQGGLGEVVISRRTASGEIAFSLFLVDRYCMGVKDCFGRITSGSQYREFLDQLAERGRIMRTIDPSSARRFVEDAVAYAENLGLKPHSDYRAARMIFGDIDPAAATEFFQMGMNGKPYFMSGPFQSAAECQLILAKLTTRCGEGGFHYTMAIDPASSHLSGSDWDQLSFDGEVEDSDEEFEDDEEVCEVSDDVGVQKRPGVVVVEPNKSRRA